MFICEVLMVTVTCSGFGASSASACRALSDSHFACSPSPSGAKEIEPPTWMKSSGTRARMPARSEEHTSELQSLMRISYAVFCLKKKKPTTTNNYKKLNEQYNQQNERRRLK